VFINSSDIGTTKSIEFSTVGVEQLVLAGTNLYDDPDSLVTVNPGLNANFAPNGTIELEFTETISSTAAVTAQLWADDSPDVLVYSTVGTNGSKVTITPSANLKYGTTYGVKVAIKENGEIIWETPTTATSLTYHETMDSGDTIAFSTVTVLGVQAVGGTGSKTNVNVAGSTNNFDANSDIYLDFDRPLDTYTAKLIYTSTGKETPITVSLEGADRILKISPTSLLAPSAGFTLKLNVESKDGQKYARNADLAGNPDDYANGTAYNTNITFTTDGTVRWGPTGLKPTVGATLAVVTTPVPKGNNNVTLRLSGLTASLVDRTFSVYRTIFSDVTGPADTGVTASVDKGAIAPAGTITANLGANPDHLDAENQIFYIRGVADDGTVIAAQVGPIDFN
jgi:hypothetical protein